MVTVQEWVGREVHDGIVFTLGPGHLLQRMLGGRTHWREAGSLLAALPSLARRPNWTNNAAGRPGLLQWTRRLTCCAQKDMTTAQITLCDCYMCCCCWNYHRHLSLFVDVSARALGSSSVFFLLIFLCLTVPLSDFPLGSSVKPSLVWGNGK